MTAESQGTHWQSQWPPETIPLPNAEQFGTILRWAFMRILSLVFTVALVVACQKVEPDPIKSFKELVTRLPTRSIGESPKTTYGIVDVAFDVKKTDSLINPVIGTIDFTLDETYQSKTIHRQMRLEIRATAVPRGR
jgi:hypothetical protein